MPAPLWKASYRVWKHRRVQQALRIANLEDYEKQRAKRRDGYRCRWPHASALAREVCRRTVKESAHWRSKGMGGDHGARSKRADLITFCKDTHQGPGSIHAGDKRVRPLTDQCMDGPCAFDEKRGRRWVEVGRERSVGMLERRASL